LAVDDAFHLPVPAEQEGQPGEGRVGLGYSSVLPTQLETSLLGDSLKASWCPAKL